MALKLETTRVPGSKVEIKIQADVAEIEKTYDRLFSHLAEQARIPGFRPGRAPRSLLERRFPEESLREMAWQEFLEKSVGPALEDLKLKPAGEPEVPKLADSESFQRGQEFEMTVTLPVQPEPVLPDYHALKLVRPSAEVTEEDVDEYLEQLRMAHAKREKVEREEVQEGDVVQACVHIRDAESGDELDHYDTELTASASSENQIERTLVGAKRGEPVSYEMTLSEPQADPEMVGKVVKVEALAEEIFEVAPPELDAEFAKQVEESLESVEALREYLRERLAEQYARDAERAVRALAVAAVDRGTQMELPQSMVQSMVGEEMRRMARGLQEQGLSQEATMEALRDRDTGLMDQAAISAVEGLRQHYIFAAIAEAEGLEPGEEEINAAIEEYAREYGMDAGSLRQMVMMQPESEEEFKDRALRKMVVDKLLETAQVEEVSRAGYPLMARRILEEAEEAQKTRRLPESETPVGGEKSEAAEAEATEEAAVGEEKE